MTELPDKIISWQTAQPDPGGKPAEKFAGPLELAAMPVPALGPGQVLVEIAGCSLCRRSPRPTAKDEVEDGAASNSVQTPLHDISGRVVAGGTGWLGLEVLIPAFSPGRYHGLSSHVPVAVHDLLEIKNRRAIPPLAHLSMAVEALAIPFQAAMHAGITPGDKVIVLGQDAEGPFLVQVAKTLGAARVVAVDTSEARLGMILSHGADLAINTAGKSPEEAAAEIAHIRGSEKDEVCGWKVFLTRGSRPALRAVMDLLPQSDRRMVIGSAPTGHERGADNLPGGGVDIIEPTGCPPEDYPRLVEWVTSDKIELSSFLLTRPMSWVGQVMGRSPKSDLNARIVFTADDFGFGDEQEAKSCR
ncbi:MAG: zinc-binding dehydrogenase [Desulfosarcinaceae bacterium]